MCDYPYQNFNKWLIFLLLEYGYYFVYQTRITTSVNLKNRYYVLIVVAIILSSVWDSQANTIVSQTKISNPKTGKSY
jgi:hypothetical protein